MFISMPTFREISRMFEFECKAEECRFEYEYTWILSDLQCDEIVFEKLFNKIKSIIKEYKENTETFDSFNQFVNDISELLYLDNPFLEFLYNRIYISILLACIVVLDIRDYLLNSPTKE